MDCVIDSDAVASKVPASNIARSVRAAQVEAPSACGVSSARKMTETNANRDVEHLFQKFGMAIRVPRDLLVYPVANGEKIIELPWVRPTSWVCYILARVPQLLCGVAEEIEQNLESFWTCYRSVHPGHIVFSYPQERLRRTLPILLHGDEGRYLKRSNYMICTIESALGSSATPQTRRCDCKLDPALGRYNDFCEATSEADPDVRKRLRLASKQIKNSKGHVYLSRFLCFGMASKEFKEQPGLLEKAFGQVAEDLTVLCTQGVEVPHLGHFYGGFLGVKGDMKFHHQVGHLTRSYYHLGKVHEYPICHLCGAGGHGLAFEDLRDSPDWEATAFVEAPWDENSAPSLSQIPFDALCPGKVFALDPFHCWKVGTGRDVCGSGIVVLARLGYFDFEEGCTQNIDDRLDRAHSCFRLWCLGNQKTAALRSFTKYNLLCNNQSCFAWGNFKGSDTSLVTQWLLFYLTVHSSSFELAHQKLRSTLVQILNSALVMWKIMHGHGVWLDPACGRRLQHHILRALRGYKVAARELMLSPRCGGLRLKAEASRLTSS